MAGLPDYNVQDFGLVIFGHRVTGLSETGIVITPDGDVTETVRGLGPTDVAATFFGVQGATIEVNLLQSSPSNAFFSDCLARQQVEGRILKGQVEVFSPNNVYTQTGECYIQSAPAQSVSKTQQERTWTFYCPQLRYDRDSAGTSFSVTIDNSLNVDLDFAFDTSFNFKL